MEYTISRHCQERYAERIMDRDSKTDISLFISAHSVKIAEDINKMIEFGELLFEGKSSNGDYNKNPVQVFLKDTWVLITDPAKLNVITIFKIDLGLGDDFNRDYISKLKEKLNVAKEKCLENNKEIDARNKEFLQLIEENKQTINEYQKIINSLKEQNESYEFLIKESETNKNIAETEVREIIGTLTSKKIF